LQSRNVGWIVAFSTLWLCEQIPCLDGVYQVGNQVALMQIHSQIFEDSTSVVPLKQA
jgi:hypothetical protein